MVPSLGKQTGTVRKAKYPKVFAIADYFISKNQKDHKGLTNKKLQKLLYYSQAWSLVLRNKKLFKEDIEAWVHGPAVPAVYFKYKDFGYKDIKEKIDTNVLSLINAQEDEILDSVWEVYGKYDADYLELLSHSEKPWQEARNGTPQYKASSKVISPKTMKEFYGQKIKEVEKEKKA